MRMGLDGGCCWEVGTEREREDGVVVEVREKMGWRSRSERGREDGLVVKRKEERGFCLCEETNQFKEY